LSLPMGELLSSTILPVSEQLYHAPHFTSFGVRRPAHSMSPQGSDPVKFR
jgi:hypothetical protein